MDALCQRFGRLNRLGNRPSSHAAIVHDKQADKNDPVYGEALVNTWRWLKKVATKPRKAKYPVVGFGIHSFEKLLPQGSALAPLQTPQRQSPVLMPAHMDMLVQTSPAPAVEPDLALYLHGEGSQRADVQIVWRADLPKTLEKTDRQIALDIVAVLPPSVDEALPLPIGSVQQLLAGFELEGLTDVEGGSEAVPQPSRTLPLVVIWRGLEKSLVGPPRRLRPGDTLVLPGAYGGLSNIAGQTPLPLDIGDMAAQKRRGQAILRLHPAIAPGWFSDEAPNDSLITARTILNDLLLNASDH